MLFYFEFSCIQMLLNIHMNKLLFYKLISNTIYIYIYVRLHVCKCDIKYNFCPPQVRSSSATDIIYCVKDVSLSLPGACMHA